MSIEELYMLCENLHKHVSLLINNQPVIEKNVDVSRYSIHYFLERVQECGKNIQTDDSVMQESFNALIREIYNIISKWQEISNKEKEITKEMQKLPCDKEFLIDACTIYAYYQKKLIESYQQVLELTSKIMETKKQK